MSARLDRRGRRIGANWWRSFITDQLHCQEAVWQRDLEVAAIGYKTEADEFRAEHPRPTLKALLIAHAGMNGGHYA